jgi:phage terminase large subunit
MRVLCAREIQKSIDQSVHHLLESQIRMLDLGRFYQVQDHKILGREGTRAAGTEFFFMGLRFNVDSIMSAESIDRVWVEQAEHVRKTSWDKLIPTIRKKGSEIWITLNPELETDESYDRFVKNPPEDAWVRKVTWRDNPWFGETTGPADMRTTRQRSEDDYLNVWEGHPKQTLEGAVYAREMREAQAEGRITKVPYDRRHPVSTYWDLGWADKTSIWFVQKVAFEYHVIDYHEDRHRTFEHYIRVLQGKGYAYDRHHLPHDGGSKDLKTGTSCEEILKDAGYTVTVLDRTDPALGINAMRTIFPQLWFDEERCADGLHALRHYRFEVDQDTGQYSSRPLHDEHSHGADAMRAFAMSKKERRARPELTPPRRRVELPRNAAQRWMLR